MKTQFFPKQRLAKIIFFKNLATLGILPTKFGLISTWTDQRDLFLEFVIREICKFTHEFPTFFLDRL